MPCRQADGVAVFALKLRTCCPNPAHQPITLRPHLCYCRPPPWRPRSASWRLWTTCKQPSTHSRPPQHKQQAASQQAAVGSRPAGAPCYRTAGRPAKVGLKPFEAGWPPRDPPARLLHSAAQHSMHHRTPLQSSTAQQQQSAHRRVPSHSPFPSQLAPPPRRPR